MQIVIDDQARALVPDTPPALGVLRANVVVTAHEPALWAQIDAQLADVKSLDREGLLAAPPIDAQRDFYRKAGKDPSRYRGAAEALARRVLQGKGLYQVNTVVDINNLISLRSLHPVASYDRAALSAPIHLRLGRDGESYKGIGKAEVNLASLPLLADAEGPFGSATSDSERAMIRPETRQVLMVVYAFAGTDGLDGHLAEAAELLARYAQADEVETEILT